MERPLRRAALAATLALVACGGRSTIDLVGTTPTATPADAGAPAPVGGDASTQPEGGTVLGPCGAGASCPAGSTCVFPIGSCAAQGECIENLPGSCSSRQYLCGCDGTTVTSGCGTFGGATGPTTGAPSTTDGRGADFCPVGRDDGGTDAGPPPVDAGSPVDATAPVESGPPADASTGDASGLPDASADAVADTGSGIDAGIVLASFALVVDGVVQTPLGCVTAPWDYAEPMQSHPHVALENTGAVPLAYNALSSWNIAPPNLPGVANGATNQLVGVLAPGAQVDITSVFTATAAGGGGIIAVLGSAAPFHSPPRSFFDEGTIPWPMGVAGSGGASTMYVVQLTDSTGCQQAFSQFW